VPSAHAQETRAKWNALESVTMATWSGSAVLGGILVDRYGFLTSNLVTASLQLVSTVPLFCIAGREPSEKQGAADEAALTDSGSDEGSGGSSPAARVVVLERDDSGETDAEELDPAQLERLLKGALA
jgi:hypothetical protein